MVQKGKGVANLGKRLNQKKVNSQSKGYAEMWGIRMSFLFSQPVNEGRKATTALYYILVLCSENIHMQMQVSQGKKHTYSAFLTCRHIPSP